MSSASLNFSLNSQIVFASGNTDLSFFIPKNLMKDNLSFSKNSIRSSDTLFKACNTNTFNITISSYAGRPRLASFVLHIFFNKGRNSSQRITSFNNTKGSPSFGNSSKWNTKSNRPGNFSFIWAFFTNLLLLVSTF